MTLLISQSLTSPLFASQTSSLPVLHGGVNTFPWFFRSRAANDARSAFIYPDTFPNRSQYSFARMAQLHQMGADFIRIPIDPSPFLAGQDAERDVLIGQVIEAVELVNHAGMTAIVDAHPYETYPAWQGKLILRTPWILQKYQNLLVELAKRAAALPRAKVVLELMNEPSAGYDSQADWFSDQRQFVDAIRSVAPALPLLLTGDRGGGIEGLLRLNPSQFDANTFYSFHYYEPLLITHQGADWGSVPWRRYVSGIEYPPVPANKSAVLATIQQKIFADTTSTAPKDQMWAAARKAIEDYYNKPFSAGDIRADFDKVVNWAKKYGIAPSRIIVGEFGTLRPGGTVETAAHYARDVRTAAESDGFAWCYFDYMVVDDQKGGFSLLTMAPPRPGDFDRELIEEGLGWKMHYTNGH